MKNKRRDREYEFTLILSGVDSITPEVEDALFEAGCDDATLAIQCGRPYITFCRAAESAKKALISAIIDVRKAGLDVVRVDDCQLVSQSDIAHRAGLSRQLVHMYISGVRGPGRFPAPIGHLAEGAPLWMWCEVAHWLRTNNMVQDSLLEESETIAAINTVLDVEWMRKQQPKLMKDVTKSIAARTAT
ncbi:MAG: hypothetical protein JSS02_33360 [Planctomycetes bacterium]|nr:hypothetical protein [Planctomycetota bacterium]